MICIFPFPIPFFSIVALVPHPVLPLPLVLFRPGGNPDNFILHKNIDFRFQYRDAHCM